MPSKKGPQGNKDQLLIALELSQGASTKEVSEKLGKPLITVQKLAKKLKEGWKPDLSEAAIAAAPPSPGKPLSGGQNKVSSPENSTETAGSNGDKGEVKKTAQPAAGYVSLASIQIRSQYTPIMYMGRLASVDKLGWPADMTFEDLTDVIYYHFFKDRGITLQGYIVDDEVNKSDNGEIKELKETVQELIAYIKKDKAEKEEAKT